MTTVYSVKVLLLFSHPSGPEDRVLYVANDTEIRSFVYPFNQSQGQKVLTHVEDNARIIGMDALFHHQKFVWATQFNPGGIFYKDLLERGQTKAQTKNIVSHFKMIFIYSKLTFIKISFTKNGTFDDSVRTSGGRGTSRPIGSQATFTGPTTPGCTGSAITQHTGPSCAILSTWAN